MDFGVASLLGSAIGAGAGLWGGSTANKFSAGQTKSQFSRQLYLSSTAHQREVEDLKKAGLNPILSAGGSGAPSYGGPSAAGSANLAQALSQGSQAGSGAALNYAQTSATKAQADQTRVDTEQKRLELSLMREMMRDYREAMKSRKAGLTGIPGAVMDVVRKINSIGGAPEANSIKSFGPNSPKKGLPDVNWFRDGSLMDRVYKWLQQGQVVPLSRPAIRKGGKPKSKRIGNRYASPN